MTEHDDPTVKKISHSIPISLDMAVDYGLVTEDDARAKGWTPYVPPKLTTRQRARIRLREIWWMRPRVHFGPCGRDDE